MIGQLKRTAKDLIGKVYYHALVRHGDNVGNRVLIYHAFGTRLAHDTYGISISTRRFETHIRYIQSHKEVILPEPETYSDLLDRNTVSITIDDGYEDTLEAVEVLTKYGIPFSLMVSTGLVGKKGYLSKAHLYELSSLQLCRIGSHCVDHVRLTSLPEAAQNDQIMNSKKMLEDMIQQPVYQMSLPHGAYSDKTIALIKQNHYKINYCSRAGLNRKDSLDLLLLKRHEIIAADTLPVLKRKISGYYDYLGFWQ